MEASGGLRRPALQAGQSWAHPRRAVDVEVIVDTDVTPVAPHFVMGASQTVVHAFLSSLLFGPLKVVVTIAVQRTLQLLIV